MQNCAIILGGLETGYMQKLALYLNSRMENQIQVGIAGEPGPEQMKEAQTVWIGPEKFVEKLQKKAASRNFIVLTEEMPEEGNGVYRYQPCEKLYQDILRRCQEMKCLPAVGVCHLKQKWIIMTTDDTAAALMVFSVTFAQMLGQSTGVLYLNLSECSGMERSLRLGAGADLSDLVMALRESPDICLDAYVRQLEGMDYVMPPGNPMILHELKEDDIQKLLSAVQENNRYEYVVLALGSTCCGGEVFFGMAESLFHLTGEGLVQECSRQEWEHFARLCLGERQIHMEKVFVPKIPGESCGSHLIYEWMEGEPGQLAKKYVEEELKEG